MSQESLEMLRRAHERFREEGEDVIYEYMDPDIELTAIEEMPGNRTHRGHAGVHDWFELLRESFGDFTWEPRNYADLGEHVLVDTQFIAEGRESGVPVEVTVYNLWTVQDGKAVRVRGYLNRSDALAAAGED
jgi:ketosteroid isomerase-like protein